MSTAAQHTADFDASELLCAKSAALRTNLTWASICVANCRRASVAFISPWLRY